MRAPRLAIVVTTIGDGEFLAGYDRQSKAEGVRDRLRVIVIPDEKSPPALADRCRSLASTGLDVVCPSLAEQEAFLARLGGLADLVPRNSDNRRNVGFLMALDWGCDVLISLDDDNYCIEGASVFADYELVARDELSFTAVSSDTGWFNACDLLALVPETVVYPRGFPYRQRHRPTRVSRAEERGTVRINAGLWLGEPDVDALTWLANPVRATALKDAPALLGRDTWTPINTQNTSLHRDAVVTYYFVRMGYPLAGMTIDRYGDIFSGYFSQACVRALGGRIRIGTPVAQHRRNRHDYLEDLVRELPCIVLLEDVTEWLREVRLCGRTCAEAYLGLADLLEQQVERFRGRPWTDATRGYFHQMAYCMRQWVAACRLIG